MNLAWVTARAARGLDPDQDLALAALGRAGVDVEVVDWDDPGVDWGRYDRVAVRSTWDYTQRLDEFTAWFAGVSERVAVRNPWPVAQWGLDKHYLADLDRAGVPIIATEFVEPGQALVPRHEHFVIKPAIGAGGRDVATYRADQVELARAHVARLHGSGRAALLQPLLGSVHAQGEWAMVYFDGRFSHAANKRVQLAPSGRLEPLFAAETVAPHTASPAQLAVAGAGVDVVSQRVGTPTWTRVDLVVDDGGTYCVLEVEVVEPSLFLAEGAEAAVSALVAALLG
jgi:glutathione synthase/RimK-type ligase-like ATP-grasp enzyme